MGIVSKFRDWLRGPESASTPAPISRTESPIAETKSAGGQMRAALAGAFSGGPISNHREEAFHFTDFSYVAIHQIGIQLHNANVSAFADGSQQNINQSRRKSIRARFGSYSNWKASYGHEEEEVEQLDMNHALMKLLARPNPYESGGMFRYRQAIQIRLTGMVFIWNVPSILGPPCQRYVIPTTAVTPVYPSKKYPFGGYMVQPSCSRWIPLNDQGFIEGSPGWMMLLGRVVDAREVQKCMFPHPVWLDDGQSPMTAGARWIDAERAINEARTSGVSNGMNPTGIWTLPEMHDNLDQDTMDATARAIQGKYGGPANSGRVLVAKPGTTFTLAGGKPVDMAYSEGFQDTMKAVLALHNVPPVAIGIQEPGSRAAYYASLTVMDHAAVQPLCDLLADSDTFHLAPQFGEGLTVEMEAQKINDEDALDNRIQIDSAARIIKVNEARALRGMPPLDGPEGDAFAGQPPAQKPGQQVNPPGQQTDVADPRPQQPVPPQHPDNPFGKPEAESKTLLAAIEGMKEADDEYLRDKFGSFIEREIESRMKSSKAREPDKPYKFSSVQINLPQSIADQVIKMGLKIAEDDLADDGREDRIHATVLYGIHANNPDIVRNAIKGFGPVRLSLGVTSIFECAEYDVVKLDVNSPQIVALHDVLTDACEYTSTHPIYIPHVTLAYVKKGCGQKYVGMADVGGEQCVAESVVFSNQSKTKFTIPLTSNKSLGMSEGFGGDGGFSIRNGSDPSYGKCPHCGAAGKSQEVRENGNTTCENGHVYPSVSSIISRPEIEVKTDETEKKARKPRKKKVAIVPIKEEIPKPETT